MLQFELSERDGILITNECYESSSELRESSTRGPLMSVAPKREKVSLPKCMYNKYQIEVVTLLWLGRERTRAIEDPM